MRRTLILWNTVALLAIFGILGGIVRAIVHAGMYGAIDRELARRAGRLLARTPRADADERPNRRGGGRRANLFRGYRFDRDGRAVAPAGDFPVWDPEAFARCQTDGALTTTITVDDEPVRVLSAPARVGRRIDGVVQVPYPVAEVQRAGALLDGALLALTLPVALVAWGGATLLTGRVLRPVRRLAAAADSLGAQSLSDRLPVVGDDEFAALAQTFNGYLARLEVAFEQQKRFTADASHELKTPLTQIKGTASMALVGPPTPERLSAALAEIDRSADTMATLVQDLLLLARGDAGRLGADRSEIDAAALLERARDRVARPDAAPVTLIVDPPDLRLRGNPSELERLLVNLLENALRHTPPDGAVTVSARAGALEVSDTGCGIPPEHLPRLGERFYRIDSARARGGGGTGLGLAICRSIAQAHGGSLHLESVPGVGTTVRVTLGP